MQIDYNSNISFIEKAARHRVHCYRRDYTIYSQTIIMFTQLDDSRAILLFGAA